jgi:glutamine---fructose-6-phosphate transaminase (isomerizing)
MRPTASMMRQEIEEIPHAVARLLECGGARLQQAGLRLRENDPAIVATIARGSSDHAATYLKYAIELSAGVPVASLAPSTASIFRARLKLGRTACLAISQSGRSPDIVEMIRTADNDDALALALTNSPNSPLANICDEVLDIMAGTEMSVAATKSFVNSVVAGLAVLAHWMDDISLQQALIDLPMHLSRAIRNDWMQLASKLSESTSLFVLGRGPSLAMAQEAALKFKETCGIHAEAYSSAEFMHGPVSLIRDGFPVLVLAARDAAEATSAESADRLAGKGAAVFATTNRVSAATALPFTETGHPLTDPLVLIASVYSFVETLAWMRGFDPDRPMHLRKITETR